MAKPGPKPMPTNVKRLYGHKPSRVNTAEPQPGEEFAEPPEWLSETARQHWDRLDRQVRILGCGPWASDADGFIALVQAADNCTRLASVITSAPMVVRGSDGSPVPNPILRTYENSCTHLLRLATEWGLTPSARGRINVGRVAPQAVVHLPADRLFTR